MWHSKYRDFGEDTGGAGPGWRNQEVLPEKDECPSWNLQGVDTYLLPLMIKALKGKIIIIDKLFYVIICNDLKEKQHAVLVRGWESGEHLRMKDLVSSLSVQCGNIHHRTWKHIGLWPKTPIPGIYSEEKIKI